MLPTLKEGHEVLVFNWWKLPGLREGDLVVIKVKGQEMIKRVQKYDSRLIFVTGDNKKDSLDSRKFGWIGKSQIIGKVIWHQ